MINSSARCVIDHSALRPFTIQSLVRVGRPDGDGGYVVPEHILTSATTVLSLGLGTDWTFDLDVRRRNPSAKIIGVDGTIAAKQFQRMDRIARIKGIIYTALGKGQKVRKYEEHRALAANYRMLFSAPHVHIEKMVGPKDTDTDVSIPTLLRYSNGQQHGTFIKMDIEGGEYDVIQDLINHADTISCITAEFHGLTTRPDMFMSAFETLTTKFTNVHIHGNNCGSYCDVLNIPDAVEITFVNNDLMSTDTQPVADTFPRKGLDVPNRADRPDYVLALG